MLKSKPITDLDKSYNQVAQDILPDCARSKTHGERVDEWLDNRAAKIGFDRWRLGESVKATARERTKNRAAETFVFLIKRGARIAVESVGKGTKSFWAIYGICTPMIADALIKSGHSLSVFDALSAFNMRLASKLIMPTILRGITEEQLDKIFILLDKFSKPNSEPRYLEFYYALRSCIEEGGLESKYAERLETYKPHY